MQQCATVVGSVGNSERSTPEHAKHPAPFTPPNCDLTDFRFMPLLVGRLRDSDLAAEQTPEENWAALLLWTTSWHQVPAASLPDVDATIAKWAGYVSQGKVSARWKRIKQGAMRGFILCSDGRWYHPVVADVAREAWAGKLKQRHRTECARIKQHNVRHGTNVPFPEFDDWIAADCPVGLPLPTATRTAHPQVAPVTRDCLAPARSHTHDVTGDKTSKGEEQGERHEQGSSHSGWVPSPPSPQLMAGAGSQVAAQQVARQIKEGQLIATGEPPTNAAWRAYAAAFEERYGVEPERNKQTNCLLANLLGKVAKADVPEVIAFFVGDLTNRYYVERRHPIDAFCRDYHGIRTQWAQKRQGVNTALPSLHLPSTRAQRIAGFAGHAAAGAEVNRCSDRREVANLETRDAPRIER